MRGCTLNASVGFQVLVRWIYHALVCFQYVWHLSLLYEDNSWCSIVCLKFGAPFANNSGKVVEFFCFSKKSGNSLLRWLTWNEKNVVIFIWKMVWLLFHAPGKTYKMVMEICVQVRENVRELVFRFRWESCGYAYLHIFTNINEGSFSAWQECLLFIHF